VVALIKDLYRQYQATQGSAPHSARIALRNAVILAFAFFGIRRGVQLIPDKTRRMGLLGSDVTVVQGSRIDLSVCAMKSDKFAESHSISLAWISSSGVLLGAINVCYGWIACHCARPFSLRRPPMKLVSWLLPRGAALVSTTLFETCFKSIFQQYLTAKEADIRFIPCGAGAHPGLVVEVALSDS